MCAAGPGAANRQLWRGRYNKLQRVSMNAQISAKPIRNMGWLLALAAALVMSTFSREADAQALTEPAATITAIYKQYQRQRDPKLPKGIYSDRLEKLMNAEKKRTPKGEFG